MGFVYGLFGGVIVVPVVFSVTAVGLFVAINSVVALLLVPVLLAVRACGRGARVLWRYVKYSLAFAIVFAPVFILIEWWPGGVF
jgi:hypothetical protein